MAARSRDLCVMACAFGRSPDFRRYLQHIDPHHDPWTEAGAKAFILALCRISSRRELDTNIEAARRFHELIRQPFITWQAATATAQIESV